MKITIAQGAFLPVPPLRGGAVEKIWFALGQEFARRGHEVTHVSRAFEGLPQEEIIEGVQHRRVRGFDAPRSLALLKGRDLLYSLRVLRVLPEADILVTNTFWLPLLIRTERFGKLYVHVARYPKGQMRFYSHAARLQSVSSHIRRAILDEAPRVQERSCVIPNPIRFSPGISDPTPTPRERRILFVGRVHPEKGLDLLVEAIGLISQEAFYGWKLVVVGPSAVDAGGAGEPYLARLQEIAQPFRERIEFAGPVFDPAQLDEHYRRSALFVYPSVAEHGEASPLAPLEAMAQGCPALVSDLECFRDYLTDGGTGFVFDHRAALPPEALATVLARLIGNPDNLAEIGRAGRERAADFSVERIADRYLADFSTLHHSFDAGTTAYVQPCLPT